MELITIELFVILKNLCTAQQELTAAQEKFAARSRGNRNQYYSLLTAIQEAKLALQKAQIDADEIIARVQTQINATAE